MLLRKSLSFLLSFSLVLQNFTPLLVLPVYAEDSTPSADTITEPTPTATPEVTPEPTQEITPTPAEEVTPAPTAEPAPEATPSPSVVITPDPTPEISPEITITPETTTIKQEVAPAPTSNGDAQAPPEENNNPVTPTEVEETPSTLTETTVPESISIAAQIENQESFPTLTTDKADYFPTEIVHISGTGFDPNTTYTLHIISSDSPFVSFYVDVTSDENGNLQYDYQLDGHYRPNYSLEVFNSSERVVASYTFTDSNWQSFNDSAGVNDEPGQKDLTKLTRDLDASNPLAITWNWDETSMSGNNTADACALFDTDNDGFANYSLCVNWELNQQQKAGSPVLYSCTDTRTDRCSGSAPVSITNGSTCSISSGTDPFPTGDNSPNDTTASCSINLADVGGPTAANLLDVCSYPSTQPNSDPSDCIVIRTDKGQLTVIKDVVPDATTTNWNFAITGPKTFNTSISGDGTSGINNVDLGTYSIVETAGSGTNLADYTTSWSCTKNGSAYLSGTGTTASGIVINKTGNVEDSLICTFTNTLNQASLIINKTAVGGDDTFDFTVTGPTSSTPSITTTGGTGSTGTLTVSPGTYSVTESFLSGWVPTGNDCVGDFTIAPGATKTCNFENTKLSLNVVKTASPVTLPEPGGTSTFIVTISNPNIVSVNLTSLTDSVFGDLSGQGDCLIPQTIVGGGSYTCTFSKNISGNAGFVHSNTITAIASGITASDDATVTITNVYPNVTLVKSVDDNEKPEPGGVFNFTLTIHNTSVETVTIDALTDTYPLSAECLALINTTLAPDASTSCNYPVTKTEAGVYDNTAWVTVKDDENYIKMASDSETITVTNVAPTITVTKSANVASLPEPGGNFTYTFTIQNTSFENVTITSLSDDKFGPLSGDGDCQTGTVLSAGASCSFQITRAISGDAGYSHTNTFTTEVRDNENSTATDDDNETVTITNLDPSISLDKNVDDTEKFEPGGVFTFSLTISNPSSEAVTITSLTDTYPLSLDCTSLIGTTISAGGNAVCTYSVSKSEPGSYNNTASVTVQDNEGNSATSSDSQTIRVVDVTPVISVTKSANVSSVSEPGGDVIYTFTVQNNSVESVEITSLEDNIFGTLLGDTDCRIGTVLSPSASCNFDVTKTITGNAGTSHTNTFTARAKDNENTYAQASDIETVSFTNVNPSVSLIKTVNTPTLPEPGGDFTYTLSITNTSVENVQITSITDDNLLSAQCSSLLNTYLTPNQTVTCSYTVNRTNAGSYPNTAAVIVTDDESNTASDNDTVTVTVTNVLPSISVTKTANVSSVNYPGGNVTYTFRVQNNSVENVTINSLSDDKFLTLVGDADCRVGTVLTPGAFCEFSQTEFISGPYNTTHTNVFTAIANDDENNNANASDYEDVRINYVPGKISGHKFNDLNGDHTKDSGEPWLSDWTIYLDLNNNGQLDDSEPQDLTNDTGYYSFTGLEAGSYYVREVLTDGWLQTRPNSQYGGDGRQSDGSYLITIDSGSDVDDRDFGNFKKAKITVHKDVLGINGESIEDDAEFIVWLNNEIEKTVSKNSDAVYENLSPDTYTVTEPNLPSGYELISIENDEITVQSGGEYDVYITNKRIPATLIVQKEIIGSEDPFENFSFSINEDDAINFEEDGRNELSVDRGTYTITEPEVEGYTTTYDNCEELVIGNGQSQTCTITNTKMGKITFTKETNLEEDETAFEFETNFTEGNVRLSNGGVKDSGYLQPGTYSISELDSSGWTLTRATCSDESDPSQIELSAGEEVTCTFRNEFVEPTLMISKSNDATTDKIPGSSVTFKILLSLTGSQVSDLTVKDLLPKGFVYRTGSYKIFKNGVDITSLLSEPEYHSPGIWNLGNAEHEDDFELIYTADIATTQLPGDYLDVAWAQGTSLIDESVLALAQTEGFVDTNFSGTTVSIIKDQSRSEDYNVEKKEEVKGQVLGASTSLPATGARDIWLLIALCSIFLGIKLVRSSKQK